MKKLKIIGLVLCSIIIGFTFINKDNNSTNLKEGFYVSEDGTTILEKKIDSIVIHSSTNESNEIVSLEEFSKLEPILKETKLIETERKYSLDIPNSKFELNNKKEIIIKINNEDLILEVNFIEYSPSIEDALKKVKLLLNSEFS